MRSGSVPAADGRFADHEGAGELWRAARAVLEATRQRWPGAADARIVAMGWATVELERATVELADRLGWGGGANAASAWRWEPRARDSLLGARVGELVAPAEPGAGRTAGPAIVVLEPDTEGRMAAALARHGEGLAAIYVAAAVSAPRSSGRGLQIAKLGPPGPGPIGPGRVLLGGPASGPHVIVLAR